MRLLLSSHTRDLDIFGARGFEQLMEQLMGSGAGRLPSSSRAWMRSKFAPVAVWEIDASARGAVVQRLEETYGDDVRIEEDVLVYALQGKAAVKCCNS
jgi:hypothetical protein